MKNIIKNRYTKLALSLLIGSIAGYAYYYYIGCNSGVCPITSNPVISTIYGGILGLIYAFPTKKKEPKNESN